MARTPDETTSGQTGSQQDARTADGNTEILQAAGQDAIDLPSSDFVAHADITRDGQDLVLEAPDGSVVIIEGYFSAEPAPVLLSPEGQALTPQLVQSFVTQSGPVQYANTATLNDESPVGAVQELTGQATVTRTDGTTQEITIGTPIYQGDIIETDDEGAVNIVFVDETSFAVSENARLAIDEYVYDPATESGSQGFSILRGVFVFTSGLIGRDDPDDVNIDTPVGSIGIRGTTIMGTINPDGDSQITIIEGAIVVRNGGGEQTLAIQFETITLSSYSSTMTNQGSLDSGAVNDSYGSLRGVAPDAFLAAEDMAEADQSSETQDSGTTGDTTETAEASSDNQDDGTVTEDTSTTDTADTSTTDSDSTQTAETTETDDGSIQTTETSDGSTETADDTDQTTLSMDTDTSFDGNDGTFDSSSTDDGTTTSTSDGGSTSTGTSDGGTSTGTSTTDTGTSDGSTSTSTSTTDTGGTGDTTTTPPLALAIDTTAIDDNRDTNAGSTDAQTGTTYGYTVATIETTHTYTDVTYTLLGVQVNGGDVTADFNLIDNTGHTATLQLNDNIDLFADGDTLSFSVRADLPDGRSVTETYNINVTDLIRFDTMQIKDFVAGSEGADTIQEENAGEVAFDVTAPIFNSADPATESVSWQLGSVTDNSNTDFSNLFEIIAHPGGDTNQARVQLRAGQSVDAETVDGQLTFTVISILDATNETQSQTVTLDVLDIDDTAPTLDPNTGLTLDEGATTLLDASMLDASDVDTADTGIQFQISTPPANGTLEIWSGSVWANAGTGDTFTMQDIIDGNVRYAHNDSETTADSFNFTLTDSAGNASGTYTFNIAVNPVNDAPTSTNDTMSTSEDTMIVLTSGDFGTYNDAEGNPFTDVQITTLPADGLLEYDVDGSSSWVAVNANDIITVADIDASRLRFTPDADENGAGYTTIGFKVGDGTDFSASEYTLSIDVTAVNDAPELDNTGTPVLTAVQENDPDPAGDTVGNMVVDGSITDVDGVPPESIAIVGADNTNGQWQYSTDGGNTWGNITGVSNTNAVLLGSTEMVRFLPDADYTGPSGNLTYKAWDQSTGTSGDTGVDTTAGTAFSTATETASVSVSATDTFTTVWETTTPSETITLPLVSTGTYNFTVNWGDGTFDTITSWSDAAATHTYTAPGTYEMRITGQIEGWSFNAFGDAAKLTDIIEWSALDFNDTSFWYASSLTTISATDIPDLSGVTDLSDLFRLASNLTDVTNINSWDVSNVISMGGMFLGASNFNGDISGWNVSSVTDMGQMFYNASAFNQNISSWQVDSVTNMGGLFKGATAFNQDISGWNTSNVTNMGQLFSGAAAFNQDISGWDVSNVTQMSLMFSGALSFNQDISGWSVNNVTNMGQMFQNATAFDQDLGNWNISNVNNMTNMFTGATGMSVANLDATLIGWAGQTLQSGVTLDLGTLEYSQDARGAIDELTAKGWTVNGGALADNSGIDTFYGSNFDDTIDAGTGNDTIYVSAGNDTIDGGGGFDTYDASALTGAIDFDIYNGMLTYNGYTDTVTNIEYFMGGSGNNYFTTIDDGVNRTYRGGTGANDVYDGSLSIATASTFNIDTSQIFIGGGGTDTVIDIELFIGGSMGDTFIAKANGFDYGFNGDGGTNTLDFSQATGSITVDLNLLNSTQTIGGGFGDYYLENFSNVIGGDFDDIISSTFGNNTLYGGAGNDRFLIFDGDGGAYFNTVDGGADTDILDGSALTEDLVVNMDTGAASIGSSLDQYTFTNIEHFIGGSNNDTFLVAGSDGSQTYDGGGGFDTYDASAIASTMIFDLSVGTVADGTNTDTVLNIEEFIGGSVYNSFIAGNGLGDLTLDGGIGGGEYDANGWAITYDVSAESIELNGDIHTLMDIYDIIGGGLGSVIDFSSYFEGADVDFDLGTINNNFVTFYDFTEFRGSVFNDTVTLNPFDTNIVYGDVGNDTFIFTPPMDISSNNVNTIEIYGGGGVDTLEFGSGGGTTIIAPDGTNDRIEGVEVYDFQTNSATDNIDIVLQNFMLNFNDSNLLTIQINDADTLNIDFSALTGTWALDSNGAAWAQYSDGTRTVRIEDNTGGGITGMTVAGVNDPPALDLDGDDSAVTGDGYTATFTEGSGPVNVTDDVMLTDVDNGNMTQAVVTLTNNSDGAAEHLLIVGGDQTIGGITVSGNETNTITLSGTDTIANYISVLQSIQYENVSNDPTLTNRHIEVKVYDGTSWSNVALSTIVISNVDTAPTLDVNNGIADSRAFEEGDDIIIDTTMISASDPDTATANIVYTVTTLPAHGMLYLNGTALAVNATFTQQDVIDGNLVYKHDGSASSDGTIDTADDSFNFKVSDGTTALTGKTFEIDVAPASVPQLHALANRSADGFVISGAANSGSNFGGTVAAFGDSNNDGLEDYIIAGNGDDFIGSDGTTGLGGPNTTLNGSAKMSLSGIGDFDGDGDLDYIIGQSDANNLSTASSMTGNAQIIDSSGTIISQINDGSLLAGDQAGYSVAGIGDVNGDGLADIIYGAPGDDDTGTDAGAAYVFYGTSTVTVTGIDPANADHMVWGSATGDRTGTSVSSMGDINNDGYADFMVASPGAGGGNTGYIEVFLGGSSGPVATATLSGIGVDNPDDMPIYHMGDINGDGISDIAYADTLSGTMSFVFGDNALPNMFADVTIGASAAENLYIDSAGTVGDFNGDGFDDAVFAVRSTTDHMAEIFVLYGHSGLTGNIELTQAYMDAPANGFVMDYDLSFLTNPDDPYNFVFSSAGDVDGDGFDDLLIGTPDANSGDGEALVVYGRDDDALAADGNQMHIANQTTAGANVIANASGQHLVGDNGVNDLDDGGFADVSMRGGAGNDFLHIRDLNTGGASIRNETNLGNIDGGTGYDVLQFYGTGDTLDFTNVGSEGLSGIEKFDLINDGQTLKLGLDDVFRLLQESSDNTLKIDGIGGGGSFIIDNNDGTVQSMGMNTTSMNDLGFTGGTDSNADNFVEWHFNSYTLLVENNLTTQIA